MPSAAEMDVQHVVQSQSELDDTETRGQMTAVSRDDPDDLVSKLARESRKFGAAEFLDVSG
jgi:hypothetical protein